ncbi:aspartate ammonia-lyase [Pseudoalteromonas sp. C2R02]|uniref:aspartate ammonia-lyase n=1 Tax=Pseudoalteromonas sp. C2R02 TaxID=2841565 RepID=UPI001C094F4F|nr:aspartate ammonia-lyase [Pseudoalteromonas sp. C2R02]MBU2971699.1 aspartate ammonia-lyase [Pseudoalteromonas sp. C2R02]
MAANSLTMRSETDLLGSMQISNNAYYGIQTQRAMDNFQLSGKKLKQHPELIQALAQVKAACAQANNKQKLLDNDKTNAICSAAVKVVNGDYDDQFLIDMIQGGAGTSSNMNINEVLANVGLELMGHDKGQYALLHPNTDVNMSQSTNDVYPTAVRLSILLKQQKLLAEIKALVKSFSNKSDEFNDILKLARTQLQDAVPMTLGQEFKSFASTLGEDIKLISNTSKLLTEVNLGGTAVGTGINTQQGYGKLAIDTLTQLTNINFVPADDLVEASSDMGAFVIYSATLKRLALKLSKISNDLRLLSMGPRAGLSEINLPARQPGSSIMPGKVNPVIPEAVSQCAYQVMGNDLAISMSAEAGQLQLNAMEPLIAVNVLDSIELLTNAIHMFRTLCVDGITANSERCKDLLDNSLGLVTALNPYLGYEASTKVAKQALMSGDSVVDLIRQQNLLTEDQLLDILQPHKMTQPAA